MSGSATGIRVGTLAHDLRQSLTSLPMRCVAGLFVLVILFGLPWGDIHYHNWDDDIWGTARLTGFDILGAALFSPSCLLLCGGALILMGAIAFWRLGLFANQADNAALPVALLAGLLFVVALLWLPAFTAYVTQGELEGLFSTYRYTHLLLTFWLVPLGWLTAVVWWLGPELVRRLRLR